MNNSQKKIKVLCYTDGSTGRDVEMLLPLRYFAEKFLNCEFHHSLNIQLYDIYRIKPDIILSANTIGSNLYFQISKLAHEQKIPIFALISEGNFRTDGSFDYWGFNKDKKFYQEYVCCWSERTKEFLQNEVPDAKDKIVLTGGTGFDKYSIYKFADKEKFLQKYNKTSYKKIIGYAGWAFGKLQHQRGVGELLSYFKGDKKRLEWVEKQRKLIRDILKDAIVDNPGTLFLLKKHPQENSPERSEEVTNEMSELAGYDNVIYLGEEEAIHDLISVSDIWTCFESTTAMEAWLMGKQTIFINPDPGFNRDTLYKGSAMVKSTEEFQTMVKEYYDYGEIKAFYAEDKINLRKEIIENTIGFGDGFNHIRAGYYFSKTLEKYKSNKPYYRFNFYYFIVHILIILGSAFYVRSIYKHLYKFKKHLWVFENYGMKDLEKLYQKYSLYLKEFYEKHNVEKQFKEGTLFKSIFKK